MWNIRESLKVYFIMGSNNCQEEYDPAPVLQEAIAGGITMFQFREKGAGALTNSDKYDLAKKLQSICRNHHIPFIVNDDIELAMELNADGVHIGQEDEPANVVRGKIGADKIIGVSVHTMEEANKAIQDGADYFGIGPVYPTKTKEDAKPARGTSLIETLRVQGFTIPIVGIGGITIENAGPVAAAGADGVSIITAISLAESPREAARLLRKNVEEALKR